MIYWVAIGVLLMVQPVQAVCTTTTANLTQATVQAAIDAANPGDTICLPAGTQTWTTSVATSPSVTLNKAITLEGGTACAGTPVTCSDGTILNDGTGAGFNEMMLEMTADNSRVTGVSFKDPRSLSDSKGIVKIACGACRFDHNSLVSTNTSQVRGIVVITSPSTYQLVDHNYFVDFSPDISAHGDHSNDTTYPGDYSWDSSLTPGSAFAAYVESNHFDHTQIFDGAYDAYSGSRIVFRYNVVSRTTTGSHGLDSGGFRSALYQELMRNDISNAGTVFDTWWNSRGGTHVLIGNTISATGGSFSKFMKLSNYRSDDVSCSVCTTGGSNWSLCDGTTLYDQNTGGSEGYACRDQIGRGPATDPANDWPTDTVSPTFSQALYPGYSVSNVFKGGTPTIGDVVVSAASGATINTTRVTTYHVINNRDFYMEASSFDGTTGTGSGLLNSRPSTCTTGVAYWATDQGTWNKIPGGEQGVLYKCTATNTWTLYYTPYEYPHPLQGYVPPTQRFAPAFNLRRVSWEETE